MHMDDRMQVLARAVQGRDGIAIPTTESGARALPSSVTATISPGVVTLCLMPVGVTENRQAAVRRRALMLPERPRLIPAAFMSRLPHDSDPQFVPVRVIGPIQTLGEHRGQRNTIRCCYATLGDEASDEPRRRHVERVVDRARPCRSDRDRSRLPIAVTPGNRKHFVGTARLDRNRISGREPGIERRRPQRDVERNAVVESGERLRIGPDLVPTSPFPRRDPHRQ
jgi:hypothetical protein